MSDNPRRRRIRNDSGRELRKRRLSCSWQSLPARNHLDAPMSRSMEMWKLKRPEPRLPGLNPERELDLLPKLNQDHSRRMKCSQRRRVRRHRDVDSGVAAAARTVTAGAEDDPASAETASTRSGAPRRPPPPRPSRPAPPPASEAGSSPGLRSRPHHLQRLRLHPPHQQRNLSGSKPLLSTQRRPRRQRTL